MVSENIVSFVHIEDAAELTGYSAKYLRKLAKSNKIRQSKSGDAVMIAWPDVQRLASSYKPAWVALPDNALSSNAPDPTLLLYTEHEDQQVQYDEAYFHNKVELGHCLEWMRRMPPKIIQSVVTSPPYWGVRKYPGEMAVTWSDGNCIGLGEEPTVEGYVAHNIEVLRQLKRVLKDNGTIWWNIGDTYQTRAYLRESSTERLRAIEGDRNDLWSKYPHKRYSSGHPYLKDKDLALVPFLVAQGAEHLGFYVRSIIIWHKDNSGIESAKDRPTTIHEYIILLAKSRFYKYYSDRGAEQSVTGEVIKRKNGKKDYETVDERNLRTVWEFPPSSRHGDHTAAFPVELPLRCLRLSTDPGDLVFDPFAGSGTTLAIAKLLGCDYFGCDILEEFVQESKRRLLAPAEPLVSQKQKRQTASRGKKTTVEAAQPRLVAERNNRSSKPKRSAIGS